MKLKQLEAALQQIEPFAEPKVKLEQYLTPPHIAARMLYTADASFQDVSGRSVLDLGCGTGALSLACGLLDADHVIGVDVDPDALLASLENQSTFWDNSEDDMSPVDFVHADVLAGLPFRPTTRFDTVVLNPPFGTKQGNRGIDMVFLSTALRVATRAVYSLHKTSTRAHILRKAKEWGSPAQVVAELRYDLPASYRFHKKASIDVQVDLWRFEPRACSS